MDLVMQQGTLPPRSAKQRTRSSGLEVASVLRSRMMHLLPQIWTAIKVGERSGRVAIGLARQGEQLLEQNSRSTKHVSGGDSCQMSLLI